MQYKGDDLDLRVPHGRAARDSASVGEYEAVLTSVPATNGRWVRQTQFSGAAETLWVDETLLACCNYAYDIAMANGAGEVGLEHLVNAMTRVEAAARVLEARGVREGQLRRDSAALIASEISTATGPDRLTPRRSPDMEDVLRRASETASRRGYPANVDDVLWVLFHYNREVPAVLLLRRLTPDWQRLDWARGRETAVAPQPEPVPQLRYMPAPSSSNVAVDALASRIGLIEESLRTVHAELASERKALSDLIRDAQRDIVAQRGDAASLRSDIAQRLETLERSLQARPDGTRFTVQLSDRIQSLEKSVRDGMGEGARNWAAMSQRLQTFEARLEQGDTGELEKALDARLAKLSEALEGKIAQATKGWTAVGARLEAVEQSLESRFAPAAQNWSAMADRMRGIERLVEAATRETGRQWSAMTDRLGLVETTLKEGTGASGSLDGTDFAERLGGLEQAVRAGFGNSHVVATAISERLDAMERRDAEQTSGTHESLLVLDDRVQTIDRLLQEQAGRLATATGDFDATGLLGPLESKLAEIDARGLERSQALSQLAGESVQRIATIENGLAHRLEGMQAGLVQRYAALEQVVSHRVAGLEKATAERHAQEDAQREERERQIADLSEALVRLSENQHTLASAIADWRHECHSDFSSVNAQLEKLAHPIADEKTTADLARDLPNVVRGPATPAEVFVNGEATGQNGAHAEPADRQAAEVTMLEPRGHGLYWWLFGTGSVAQANREAEVRWKQMHDRMREARERRREQA